MITAATYTRGGRTATIGVERIDTWIEDTDHIVNFPWLVELDGNRLYMGYAGARHGGENEEEGDHTHIVLSEDGGQTWDDAPEDVFERSRNPITGRISDAFCGGCIGYLRDGSIVRIGAQTQDEIDRGNDPGKGNMHEQFQLDDPTFRWQRASREGRMLESSTFKVTGMPWGRKSYQTYATILELDSGDLLTAMEWVTLLPESEWRVEGDCRPRKFRFGVFIVRSHDRGTTWEFVANFDPDEVNPVYGHADRAVDEGFVEADVAQLPNGDLICVMRTGSYSPMFQSRSADGGRTWSTPMNTGWPSVKPRLQVLPNGVVACASGRGAYGHPQVTHVMLSLDGTAQHWETPFCFHTGPGCSYISTMQQDGKLHVIYSHSDFTRDLGAHGLPTQRIRRAVLDVTVAQVPVETSQSPYRGRLSTTAT